MPRPVDPLSDTLPPLIFGTATFNYQVSFPSDPDTMDEADVEQ